MVYQLVLYDDGGSFRGLRRLNSRTSMQLMNGGSLVASTNRALAVLLVDLFGEQQEATFRAADGEDMVGLVGLVDLMLLGFACWLLDVVKLQVLIM